MARWDIQSAVDADGNIELTFTRDAGSPDSFEVKRSVRLDATAEYLDSVVDAVITAHTESGRRTQRVTDIVSTLTQKLDTLDGR